MRKKSAIHLFLLFSLLGMLSATLFTSYIVYREYQYKQGLLCSDLTSGFRNIRVDILSDDPQTYLRAKAIKLVAATYAEIRTGMPLSELNSTIASMEMNDLNYMCSSYPDYQIGQIVRYGMEKDLKERSRFNREFSNMLGWQKIEQEYQLTVIGEWLTSEARKNSKRPLWSIM